MAKTPPAPTGDILDQVNKASAILEQIRLALQNPRSDPLDGATLRARLNAAKAHVTRAMEKAQNLR
ncbi:MAG: hypothetical protein H7831_02950 [Magnetococcus sp. WYHC-3]